MCSAVSWEPIDGAIDTLAVAPRAGMPFRLITNTTTHTRQALAATLRDAGFDRGRGRHRHRGGGDGRVPARAHPGARVFLLSDGDAREDLEGVTLVGPDDAADVVVIGGACDEFTYATMNHVFRMLMDGAALVGMHRNMYLAHGRQGWSSTAGRTSPGSRSRPASAAICGKPAPAFFPAALELLGVPRGARRDGRRRRRERRARRRRRSA